MLNLNYRKKLQGGEQEISGGLGVGGKQWGWDQPKYVARMALDPNIPASGSNQMKMAMNLGFMYKKQNLGRNLKDFYF